MTDGNSKERLVKALEKLVDDDWEPPEAAGPVPDPVDRFLYLPAHTRRGLARMSEEDWADLNKILLGWRRTSAISWFFKWVTLTVVGGFVAAWALGEKILEIIKIIKGGR